MDEKMIKEILDFVKKCDDEISNHQYSQNNAAIAAKYLSMLRKLKKDDKTTFIMNLIKKLQFIIDQLDAINYHKFKKESLINLVSLSVTDYIINLVKEKHLIDPLLIARFVYIELAKVLYYDISYIKQVDDGCKKIRCAATIDPKKEKIFTNVICTEWLQIYAYILNHFGIEVTTKSVLNPDHYWGEIKVNDNYIVIVDATDYIDSSIDLSNAKSVSPTVGFAVLPKEYSGLRLHDIFCNPNNAELAKKIKDYYEYNSELDFTLGYINKKGYKVDNILRENELFNKPSLDINKKDEVEKIMQETVSFFEKLKIPNNMDGYEVYAYYYKFIKHLPKYVIANTSLGNLYVDSSSYKQEKIKPKFLHAPLEYLKYLDGSIYNMYYKYLSEDEYALPHKEIMEKIKKGELNSEQVRDLIVETEMKFAEVNRNLSPYYVINKLQFYEPITSLSLSIQLYEPMMGKKILRSDDEYDSFKKLYLQGKSHI